MIPDPDAEALRASIGSKAKVSAAAFTLENTYDRICRIADDLVNEPD